MLKHFANKGQQMKIMMTGTGGFIGRNLDEYLAEKHTVLAVKRSELDLLDAVAVEKYISEHQIDLIIHCAAIGGSRKTNYDRNSVDIVEQNLRMFFNLERCLSSKMRMIHFGSGAEYDREHWQHKMPEEYFEEHVPTDSYGYAKYIISKYTERRDNIVCLRILGLFGKYEDYRFKFISNAIVKNLLHMPIIINQNVVFDYLYIDDFLKIIEYFIEISPSKSHYNITPTQSIDLLTVANIINQISNFKSEICILKEGMNSEYTGDNSRLMNELGAFSFTEYYHAIDNLYKYYAQIIETLDISTIKDDPYIRSCQ